jgi:2-polyprenyl-3-methyl-5-hydroxy-6-metoxy-1,4-benzoquinol methylase
MYERAISAEDLARLKAEREAADRRYNEALTSLDRALTRVPEMPHAPPGPDEHQVTPINQHWDVLRGASPLEGLGGWRRRLAGFVWKLVEPSLQRQQTFNSLLVDHVNRGIPVGRDTRQAVESTIATLRDQLAALSTMQSHLVMFLQQITPYVDTKDREFAGVARRLDEILERHISAFTDEMLRRWESMLARSERESARVSELLASHDDVRRGLAALQQASVGLRRELERVASSGIPVTPREPASPRAESVRVDLQQAAATTADAYKYVGFEDRFRGSREEIRARQAEYVALFAGARDVLDVGCGRGEFLDLLREAGIPARGLDVNREMVSVCRERGLDVEHGDVLAYLRGLPDGALGGLIALQVVEHLQPDYLIAFLGTAYEKLRPGSTLVVETINPACWFAFFESYVRDITHARPLHPDTLSYYVTASGFQKAAVRFSAPVPDSEKLSRLPGDDAVASTINASIDRLNSLLFTFLDYTVTAVRM